MVLDFNVSLSPEETNTLILDEVLVGIFSGALLDHHVLNLSNQSICMVSVYEKYFARANNRLTLTATIDNVFHVTHVHCVFGGGGQVGRFDWGAADKFKNCLEKALEPYII